MKVETINKKIINLSWGDIREAIKLYAADHLQGLTENDYAITVGFGCATECKIEIENPI